MQTLACALLRSEDLFHTALPNFCHVQILQVSVNVKIQSDSFSSGDKTTELLVHPVVDVWCIGVAAFEMIFGFTPFDLLRTTLCALNVTEAAPPSKVGALPKMDTRSFHTEADQRVLPDVNTCKNEEEDQEILSDFRILSLCTNDEFLEGFLTASVKASFTTSEAAAFILRCLTNDVLLRCAVVFVRPCRLIGRLIVCGHKPLGDAGLHQVSCSSMDFCKDRVKRLSVSLPQSNSRENKFCPRRG